MTATRKTVAGTKVSDDTVTLAFDVAKLNQKRWPLATHQDIFEKLEKIVMNEYKLSREDAMHILKNVKWGDVSFDNRTVKMKVPLTKIDKDIREAVMASAARKNEPRLSV